MKQFLKFVGCLLAIVITSGCSLFSDSKLTVINESDLKIDSVLISINDSLPQKEVDIEPNSRKTFSLNTENVEFNSHHISINVDFYSLGEKVGFSSHYNDLSGALDSKYEIVFTEKGKRAKFRPLLDSVY